jgi:hypothetical protein
MSGRSQFMSRSRHATPRCNASARTLFGEVLRWLLRLRGRGGRLRRPPIFRLTRAIQVETTCGESPFTQSIRIALAAFCKCYNSGGNDLFHGLVGVPEAANVFYCSVVSIRHHLNVRLIKYRIADEWNYRGHGFLPFGAISFEDSLGSETSLFKIDHDWGAANVR